jgi:protein-tyrosine phosphatase
MNVRDLKHYVVRKLSGPLHKVFRHFLSIDLTWVTERIAMGGGIWNRQNMAKLAGLGITHIINMQIEFDDRPLAAAYKLKVLCNPTADDLCTKPMELFQNGVDFALQALNEPESKLYIHCASGSHRAPLMTLAVLCALGSPLEESKVLVKQLGPKVDFVDAYMRSLESFVSRYSPHSLDGLHVLSSYSQVQR